MEQGSIAKKPKIRKADDRVDEAPKDVQDLFGWFDPEAQNKDGTLTVKNPHPDLHYLFETAHPESIERARRKGYVAIEDVRTHLGTDLSGETVGSLGTRVKVFACLKDHREKRHQIDKDIEHKRMREIFREDADKPQIGHMAPPPGYEPDNT